MARILLVEDEAVLAELLREVLELGGLEVEVAPDVARGLELFRAGTFDLVISDFLLPDRTGLDLAREIAAGDSPPPLILASAYLEPEVQALVEAIPNVVEVVRKPLKVFVLRDRVEHHIATWERGPPGRGAIEALEVSDEGRSPDSSEPGSSENRRPVMDRVADPAAPPSGSADEADRSREVGGAG